MELRHLRYFIALAGSLNFTRAAERVHVTQSTLSHQIRQLEIEIGQNLFERVRKRVVITPAGETFLVYATRALREIDQGLSELKHTSASMTGELRLGATHTFNQSFIPDCVAQFLQDNPTMKVVIEELAADTIAAQVESGKLDLGVAYRPEVSSNLTFEPLYNEELLLVVSTSHPLAKRKRIRIIELHLEPLVLLPPSFSTRRLLEECFAAAGAEPSVVAETNTVAAMLAMVTRLPIGCIAATSAISPNADLRMIPLESPTPMRTPGLLFNPNVAQTLPALAFAGLLRKRAATAGTRVH